MFLHAGFMHVAGNLWFLRLFGDNVEDAVGRVKYLGLYLISGLAAAFAQYIAAPDATVPMLGASGAIGGVLGAYAVLYPRARVLALMPGTLGGVVQVPSIVYLGLWLALQVFGGFGSAHGGGGVAYWAHIGGFATGAILGLIMRPHSSGTPQAPGTDATIGGRYAET
jgi:membrane associated rhomboid family serine protease